MEKGIVFRAYQRQSLGFRWLVAFSLLSTAGGILLVIANIERSSANIRAAKKGAFSGPAGTKRNLKKEDYLRHALRLKARVRMAYGDYAKAQPLAEQA